MRSWGGGGGWHFLKKVCLIQQPASNLSFKNQKTIGAGGGGIEVRADAERQMLKSRLRGNGLTALTSTICSPWSPSPVAEPAEEA